MTYIHRKVEGTILRLRCDACGSKFPHFLFSGEGDSDTTGLYSASACGIEKVAIVEATPVEWNNFASNGRASIESRLLEQFSTSDLKLVRLLRVEQEQAAVGLSFSDFRKSYKQPISIYSCVCCNDGESRAIAEITVKDFEGSGGKILLTGRLALQN